MLATQRIARREVRLYNRWRSVRQKWDERPLLLVVKRPGATVTREEMLEFFNGRVAKWWIPDDVVFVAELPHTATGKINGVSITQFKFTLTQNNPNFSFDNRAGITDTDGDQIIFKVLGTGRFVVPALKESPSTPAANEVLGGLGGPVKGTYEVLAVSGKYVGKYKVGEKFRFAAVGYNPNPASMAQGQALGASYVEVFSNSESDD